MVLGQVRKPAAAQSRTVNLYSSRHYDTDEELYNSFPNGEVNLIEGNAAELIERIKSEAERSPADVLITVDAGNLWQADQDGLFLPTNSRILRARIPENLRHPDGHWFGFSTRARVIYYNRDRVDPSELSTYEDLASDKWRGRILIRSSSNIYNKSLIASLIAAYDEPTVKDWLTGLVANLARNPEGNDTAQIKACAAGEGDIAIANTYYFARLMRSDVPEDQEVVRKVGLFFPNQGEGERGTHVNISGGGVLKNSPNPDAAVSFLEHLSTRSSQEYFAEGNNEYPVVDGVEPSDVLKSLGDFVIDPVNVEAYGIHQEAGVRLMDEVGWQ
jgi:iron(III) transport system substrate-binding protein